MAASACVADRAWRPEISSRKNCGIPAPDADMLRGRIEADGRNAQKFDFAVPDHLIEEGYLAEDTNLDAVPRIARQSIPA